MNPPATTLAQSDLERAYRDDAKRIISITPIFYLLGMIIETASHVSTGPAAAVIVHAVLAAASAVLIYLTRSRHAERIRADLIALVLWAIVHISVGAHVLLYPSSDQELSRLALAAFTIGTAALILPTRVGNTTLALSCIFLLLLFWHTATGSLFEILSIPVVICFMAVLLRLARRWGIQQRLLNETLARQLQEQQLQAQRSKTAAEVAARLSGTFAHHFNNQLQSILLGAEGASMSIQREHPSEGFLSTIQASAMRGAAMVRDLVQYASDRPLQRKPFTSRTLIEDLRLDELVPANVQVRHNGGNLTLYADLEQMVTALEELVRNAGWVMQDRGGTVQVEFSRTGDDIDIKVADDGPGFATDLIDTATEPFTTSQGTARFGLGLALVRSIAERHDGSLRIESAPDQSAILRMRIKGSESYYLSQTMAASAPGYEL